MIKDTVLFFENARKLKYNFPEQKQLKITHKELYALHDENPYMSVLEPKTVEGMEVVVDG